jgi:GT2 family glycosyltransferase
MKVSIVIVNWNARDYLRECLVTIFNENFLDEYEVLLVDNASTDDSLEVIKREYPLIKIVANNENIGFSRANNQAIRECQGEYILLLNPDTEIRPFAIKKLLEAIKTHSNNGIVGPRLLNRDGSLQVSCYPFPTLAREFWRLLHLDKIHPLGSYDQDGWNLTQPREVDSLQGACLLIRREVFDQVGLLDEDYFMYTEEIDFCYRAKKAGWKIVWVPTAEVIHFGGQSTSQAAASMFLQLYHSKLLFFRKHYGKPAAWIYKMIIFCASLIRLALTPFAWLEKLPKREQHLALSRNYLHLLAALPQL